MRLRHRLYAGGFQAIAALRVDRLVRPLAQGRGVILMFHRVRPRRADPFAPNGVLEITPEFLECVLVELRGQGYDVVPIDAVPDLLAGRAPPRPFAVITFDDGYRDNLEYAWPVLKRHRAAWTLFVTAEFAEGGGRLWWLELEDAIARLDRIVLRDQPRTALSARTPDEKQAAFGAIYKSIRTGPEHRLRAIVADLAEQAGLDVGRGARDVCLGWDDLRSLGGEPDLTIGAHTLSHPILAKHDAGTAAREIAGGKSLLEGRLGRKIRHFAYPFGDRSAASAREFRLAREAGFATAVTSRPGHLFADHAKRLHALPRVSINGLFQSRTALRCLLSGVPFLAWNGRRIARIEDLQGDWRDPAELGERDASSIQA
jgi:peptidoglycan/xylan/chitin deacetylase (PgdA/CDA1 family)